MDKAEYARYVEAFARGTQGLNFISSGACPGCETCGLSRDCSDRERELAGESYFSWSPCDFCNRPTGGNRTPAHARDDSDELYHFGICDDCVHFAEYGRLDDSTMLEIETSQDEEETPVLFRVHRSPKKFDDEVTAVFPCEPGTYDGSTMICYAHIGQHGQCSLAWYRETRPARPEEYADLKRELEAAPYRYRLKVYARINRNLRDRFSAEVRRLNSRP